MSAKPFCIYLYQIWVTMKVYHVLVQLRAHTF